MNHKQRRGFVMSYSCGKDSTLALHRMLAGGDHGVALLVMVNEDFKRSYFHGADDKMLKQYEEALQIPMLMVPTQGHRYHLAMEEALQQAKAMGAEIACFGDIDIEGNRMWSEQRCKNVGLDAAFPLWHRGRKENVQDLIELGYRCLIKSVNGTQLPKSILGKVLDAEIMDLMEQRGIDVCGENGEYHTLVVDGPIFHKPIAYTLGKVLDFGTHSVIEIDCMEMQREHHAFSL